MAIWIIRECRTNCKGRSCPWAQVDRDMCSSGQHDELWPSDYMDKPHRSYITDEPVKVRA